MADDQVTRSVDLDADVDDVWRAVADPDERALWLDDPDARARRVRVDEVTEVTAPTGGDAARRMVWTWWHPGDEGDASTVSVVVAPRTGGGTRVVVTERLVAPAPATLRASASASAGGFRSRAAVLWGHRMLGLELLFLASRAGLATAVRV
jgi:uncharacterized protein YndB with AHSA1/START domain